MDTFHELSLVVTILLFLHHASTIICGHHFPECLIEGITEHNGTFIYASPFHYNLLAGSNLLAPGSFKKCA